MNFRDKDVLRSVRTQLGLTRLEIAKLLGYENQGSVDNFEQGRKYPSNHEIELYRIFKKATYRITAAEVVSLLKTHGNMVLLCHLLNLGLWSPEAVVERQSTKAVELNTPH